MLVVANKLDSAQDPERIAQLEKAANDRGLPFMKISAVTGQGIEELKRKIFTLAHPDYQEAEDTQDW